MGCDFGQGALIAPPMPQDDFLELLLRRLTRGHAQADRPFETIEAIDRVA